MEIEKIRSDYIKQFDQTFASECKTQFGSIHHTKKIKALVISSDDKRLVSGSVDKSMIIWNLETRKSIRRIKDIEGNDKQVKDHDSDINEEQANESDNFNEYSHQEILPSVAQFEKNQTDDDRPRPGINSIAISNNGQYLVSVNEKGNMIIWNLRTLQPKIKFDLNISKIIRKVAISPDSKHFVTGARDGHIKLWNFNKKEDVHKFPSKHSKGITALEISPNGQFMVSAAKDLSICVWNFEAKYLIEQHFEAHYSLIWSLAISKDSKTFFTGSLDGVIKLWNFDRKREPFEILIHTGSISGLSLTCDGVYLISAGHMDNTIQIYNIAERRVDHVFENVHQDGVHSIATTHDSKYIISGSGEGRIKLWSIDERKMVEKFDGAHEEEIINVAISSDGNTLISVAFDKSLKIWNAKTQELIHNIENADDEDIFNIAISKENQYFATGSCEGSLKLWSLKGGRLIYHFEQAHNQHIMAVLFTKDSERIITASSDKTMKVWNLRDKEMEYLFKEPHSAGVTAIQLTGNEDFIVSASGDKSIKKWDMSDKKCRYFIEDAHNDEIFAIAIHPKYIISASGDKTIKIWDINSKYLCHTFKDAHSDAIWSLSMSSDCRYLVSGSVDKTMKVWSIENFQELHHLDNAHDSQITQTIITADNTSIISCSFDRTIKIWQLESNPLLYHFEGLAKDGIKKIALSGDEKTFAFITGSNSIQFWNLTDKLQLNIFEDDNENPVSINSLALSKNGQYVIYGTMQGSTCVFDLQKNEMVKPKNASPFFQLRHRGAINVIKVTSDDLTFATGSQDKSIVLWNLKTGDVVGRFKEKHKEEVLDLAFSRNANMLVSGSADRSMNLWRLDKMQLVYHFENAHIAEITCVSITYNMKYIISGSADMSLKIWDLITFTMKHQFTESHSKPINSITIHHNSTYLISCAQDKAIKIWNIENRDLVHVFHNAHEYDITSVACSQKGDFFLSGSDDGTVKMWKIPSLILKSRFGNIYLGIFPNTLEDDDWIILPYNFNQMHDYFLRIFHVNEFSTLSHDEKFKIFSSIIAKKMHFEDIRHENFYKFLERTDRFGNIPFEYVIGHEHMKNVLKINFLKFQKKFNVPNFMSLMKEMHHKFLEFLQSETKSNSKIVITFLGLCLDQFDEEDGKKGRLAPNFKRSEYGLSTKKLVETRDSYLENHIQAQLMKDTDEKESQKLKFYRTTWPLNYRLYSKDTYELLNFLGKQNKRFFFENKFVMLIFQHFWKMSKKYQLIFFYFHSVFMIFFTIDCILSHQPDPSREKILLSFAGALFGSEILQIRIRGYRALMDFWNMQDLICYSVVIATMSLSLNDTETGWLPYLKTIALFSGYFRLIGYLRIFDGMRSLIRTIIEILKDMKNLIIILFFTIAAYSAILQSFEYGGSDNSYFDNIYNSYLFLYESQLLLGGEPILGLKAITMIFPFVINVIFLNLLISLMGDTFDKLQEKSLFADNQEKLKLILEIVTFARYFHQFQDSFKTRNHITDKRRKPTRRFSCCKRRNLNEIPIPQGKQFESFSTMKTLRLMTTSRETDRKKPLISKPTIVDKATIEAMRIKSKPNSEKETYYIDTYVKQADDETFYLMFCEEDAGDIELEWEGKMNYISRQIDQTKDNIQKVQKGLEQVRKDLKSEVASIKETSSIQISLMQSNLNYLVRLSGKSMDCSVETTGIRPSHQDCYHCIKCSVTICTECAQECHQGHQMKKESSRDFVCQCSFLNSDCKKKVSCTLKYTGRKYYDQKTWSCKTCKMPDKHGICNYCKEKCHHGHELVLKEMKEGAYCDCPEFCPNESCIYRAGFVKLREQERLDRLKHASHAKDKREARTHKSLGESDHDTDSDIEIIHSIFTKNKVSQLDLDKINKANSTASNELIHTPDVQDGNNSKEDTSKIKKEGPKTEPTKNCTIESSSTVDIEQDCYYCITCDVRFCTACSEACHKNHDFEYQGEKSFACECYFQNQDCLKRNFCTYKYTQNNNYPQVAFDCLTCSSGLLICGFCIKSCHQDHKVEILLDNYLSYCECPKKCADICKCARFFKEEEKKMFSRVGFRGMTRIMSVKV